MDCLVHGVAQGRTRLSGLQFHNSSVRAVISKPIRGVCLGLEGFIGRVWEGQLVKHVKRQEGSSQRCEHTGQVRECGGKDHGGQRRSRRGRQWEAILLS